MPFGIHHAPLWFRLQLKALIFGTNEVDVYLNQMPLKNQNYSRLTFSFEPSDILLQGIRDVSVAGVLYSRLLVGGEMDDYLGSISLTNISSARLFAPRAFANMLKNRRRFARKLYQKIHARFQGRTPSYACGVANAMHCIQWGHEKKNKNCSALKLPEAQNYKIRTKYTITKVAFVFR